VVVLILLVAAVLVQLVGGGASKVRAVTDAVRSAELVCPAPAVRGAGTAATVTLSARPPGDDEVQELKTILTQQCQYNKRGIHSAWYDLRRTWCCKTTKILTSINAVLNLKLAELLCHERKTPAAIQ